MTVTFRNERNGFVPTYQRSIHEFGQTFLCQYYVPRFYNGIAGE